MKQQPYLSIVIPIFNEVHNIVPLLNELHGTLDPLGKTYEIILVDDGSNDGSREVIEKSVQRDARIQAIFFSRNSGQTAALEAGFRQALGEVLITLDGDGQNDPKDIPRLLQKLDEGFDFVAGRRAKRKDKLFSRKLPSNLANLMIRYLFRSKLKDLGCTLKAYRKKVIEQLQLYGEQHRYINLLVQELGVNVTEMDVNHRPRNSGKSKYGILRSYKVILDLITIWFLRSFRSKPSHVFGGVAVICMGMCIALLANSLYDKYILLVPVHRNPLFIIAVVLCVISVQFLALGLLAELIIRTYFETSGKKPYRIDKILFKDSRSVPLFSFACESNQRPVLVTGAAGFIAHHLIRKLLEQKIPVLGIDNFDSFYPRALKEKNISDLISFSKEIKTPFNFLSWDITHGIPAGFSQYSIQSVIHLAAKAGVRPSIEQPEAYLNTNVLGTLKVLQFCKQEKIQEMVFMSSSSVYGSHEDSTPFKESDKPEEPVSPYAASKRAGELYCYTFSQLYAIRCACLRLFTVYGPRQRPDLALHKFAKQAFKGETLVLFGDGKSSRDYTYVSDTVEGIYLTLKWLRSEKATPFSVFNLGSGSPITLKEMVAELKACLKFSIRTEYSSLHPADVPHTFADLTLAKETLGYSPKVSFRQGVKKFVEWFEKVEAPAEVHNRQDLAA